MPQILIKLIEHLQADDAGMPELAALIAKDAAMTSKILTVANSSAYHRNARVVGLEQSLVSLGTDMIKTLVISESVFQTFNSFPHSSSTDLRGFWKGSLTTAVIARDIAKQMEYPHVEEAYLAGLLHNVGRLALLATAPKEYAFNFMARDDEDLCAVEQRTLQITHSEAGAWLIERWHLDSFLADSVLYHHEPISRLESAHPLIRVVRLAHLLCFHEDHNQAIEEAGHLCGLDAEKLEQIVSSAARQVEKSAAYLGIDLAGADDIPTPTAYAAPMVDPVQQRLSEEVRNMVLVSEMGQTFARQQGEAGLLDAMTRSARILFDFENAVVLLENPTGHALHGTATGEQQQRLAEFVIPLNKGGVVAEAATERKLTFVSRDSQALSVAEEQLFRILGSEGMVCLPLVANQRCLGVLIGGAPAWQMASFQKRERFLQSFGTQAAAALETAISERGHTRRQIAHVAEEYREASRRVVHEVNNPLSIIKNYLSVLDGKLAKREPVVGEMSILNEEIDRVGQLINGLADLQPTESSRVTDVGRVVDDVLRLFRATDFVPASVQIVVRMQEEPAEIDGDADLLKQILVNLIKNAVEALADGGKIEISNRGHVNRERKLYLELVVSDTGPGLSAEVLANLFSAVRSTKEGAHHGLGLSIVHSLVKKMQGLITCRSGKAGTTFEILLPARGSTSQVAGVQTRAMDSV
ncbi:MULTISPECIES: HDOD domain-containing protein [unclassified Duganella]|uniref:HDOD domain-containing protein n=1 Tax=unclassified Duganella TaxID=2636909 RepID=UPI000E3493D3|nr:MULTISPECIES: HDOD domain-containing protein [unclassified Duganella]RFP11290.1 HDOD domain-containing protein [Duganella sp. BJB475]RFP29609.1 HDOD domain-containing protein [Duganella sp. BJB476]